jgi:hypothetical protein
MVTLLGAFRAIRPFVGARQQQKPTSKTRLRGDLQDTQRRPWSIDKIACGKTFMSQLTAKLSVA